MNNKSLSSVLRNEESLAWLKSALDPFHDTQLDVRGLPDMRLSPSVVQVHTQSYTITAPTSAAGFNWDATVLYTGFDAPMNLGTARAGMITVPSSSLHVWDHASISTGAPFGALNIWAGQTGNMSTGAPVTSGDTYACLGSVLQTDRCRVIGVGIELHNTTAEVYKQGSLTVAQLPDLAEDSGTISYKDSNGTNNVGYNGTIQADRCCVQANTIEYLQNVPGSHTWDASEGCYLVPRLCKMQNNVHLLMQQDATVTGSTYGSSQVRLPILYGSDGKVATPEPKGWTSQTMGGLTALVTEYPALAPSGFAPAQIFLSNLSNSSSIQVVFRTIVEYFPSVTSPFLPLAHPSPNFDPFALALYSEVIKHIPYADTVDSNASGDMFRNVVKAILSALEIGSPFMGQYGPLVTSLAKSARMGLEKLNRNSQPKVNVPSKKSQNMKR